MDVRFACRTRRWLLCAATGLVLIRPATVTANDENEVQKPKTESATTAPAPAPSPSRNPAAVLGEAVKRELDQLFGRNPHRSANRHPGVRPASPAAPQQRTAEEITGEDADAGQSAPKQPEEPGAAEQQRPATQLSGQPEQARQAQEVTRQHQLRVRHAQANHRRQAQPARKPGLLQRIFSGGRRARRPSQGSHGHQPHTSAAKDATPADSGPALTGQQADSGVTETAAQPKLRPDFLRPRMHEKLVPAPTTSTTVAEQPVEDEVTEHAKTASFENEEAHTASNEEPSADEAPERLPEVTNSEVEAQGTAEAEGDENPFAARKSADDSGETAPEPPAPPEAPLEPGEPEVAGEPADEEEDDHREKLEKIAEREEQTGLKGFCPVTLRDKRELVDGKDEFTATFESQTYLFASPEAKDQFELNPTRYAPVAAGNDITLLDHVDEEVAGSLDHALWYKDRLHLFSSHETRNRFIQTLHTSAPDDADAKTAEAEGNEVDASEADAPDTDAADTDAADTETTDTTGP